MNRAAATTWVRTGIGSPLTIHRRAEFDVTVGRK
jgi:hypothetical protein